MLPGPMSISDRIFGIHKQHANFIVFMSRFEFVISIITAATSHYFWHSSFKSRPFYELCKTLTAFYSE